MRRRREVKEYETIGVSPFLDQWDSLSRDETGVGKEEVVLLGD